MRSFFLAALLALRVGLGIAETEDGLSEWLYNYAAYYGDYPYPTGEYYSENITLIPTMFPYDEEPPESAGAAPRCPPPLAVLSGLLALLL